MAQSVPAELRYTAEHEWVSIRSRDDAGATVRLGVTDFAQAALGDVVYVTVEPLGTGVTPGDTLGEVESTKSVSEVYAPLAGEITAHNSALETNPELINRDPYGQGWLVELRVTDVSGVDTLLDSTKYGKLISQ
ncbi:MAG TPA: glycine cleavage system protein GcvH [Mycobacteriales bacterium]|jgi:glycine cleavage system H protein|nr:glycine cleavage system protein GcvH [Mycobacteriales bacterium]